MQREERLQERGRWMARKIDIGVSSGGRNKGIRKEEDEEGARE